MAYTKKRMNAETQETNMFSELADSLENAEQEAAKETKEEAPVQKQPVVAEKKERAFAPDDLIRCRSVVQGALIFKGPKSGTVYRWDAPNDITEVEYQDLRSARVSKHQMLMKAYFIIEDGDVLNMDEWAEVKAIYGKLYSRKDLTDIFRIDSVQEMIREINSLPEGVKAQMANIAKSLMESGKLDSISKIKAIDAALDTDLMLFVVGNSGNN